MKIFIGIILLIANLGFSQNASLNISETNTLNNSLEYSSTIDVKRFEQFYVPITATAINDFSYMNISDGNSEKPPLSALRIGGEIATGSILGYGSAHLLVRHSDSYGVAYLGAVGALTFGTALGVYIIGTLENQKGSYIATLFGSIAGLFIGTSLSSRYSDSEAKIDIFFLVVPVLSTIAFNITRKYDFDYQNKGLTNVNLISKSAKLGIPNIYFSDFQQSNIISINTEVINVKF